MTYVASRHVTHYFVQYQSTNPLGRPTGWVTTWQGDDDPNGARAYAKTYKQANPTTKVRITKRPGVSGGYTSAL